MTITELYQQLSDKKFQDPATGNLFSNAYMYIYDPEKEYSVRKEIEDIKDRLVRPNNFIDVLILDIFDEFCDYLKNKKFGNHVMFDFLLEKEKEDPKKVTDSLIREAKNDEFFVHIDNKIKDHFNNENEFEKVYVLIHGFGQIYPYLRTSKFLNKFERFFIGEAYKMILFFPGEVNDNYSLFNLLNDENPYRAIKLINQ